MKDIKIKIWRAPFATTVALYFNFGQGEWSGYSLQVLTPPPRKGSGFGGVPGFPLLSLPDGSRSLYGVLVIEFKSFPIQFYLLSFAFEKKEEMEPAHLIKQITKGIVSVPGNDRAKYPEGMRRHGAGRGVWAIAWPFRTG
jgi:hypothetical protein